MPSARTYGFLSRLSQCFFMPDNKIGWRRKALARARQLVREKKFDAVYATAPPYTDFLIGRELKKEFRIPFVIDYRDAWLENPLHRYCTPLHRLRHHHLEKNVLQRADRIVTINRRIKELIVAGYDDVAHGEVEIIPQGYDQEDFDAVEAAPEDGKMRFVYSGTFYYNRTPKYFLEGLKLFLEEHPAARREVSAEFVGNFGDENIRLIRGQGLEEQVVVHGYVAHREAISLLKRADVLWMMLGGDPGDDMMSTGKLFEYFGARKPILGCVPEGVARKAIAECGAGFLAPPDDPRRIADAIAQLHRLWREKALPRPAEQYPLQYERRALTGRLAKILHSLVDHEETARV
jgi:glycosyltransferase involved in cell wall biosynthesis